MSVGQSDLRAPRSRRAVDWIVAVPVLLGFLVVGLVGTYRYVDNFWLYRGFAPPRDPTFVQVHGHQETISVVSPALGGRSQQVLVYLPPGYDASRIQRYPVLYLLHGFPGRPLAFLAASPLGSLAVSLIGSPQLPLAVL